MIWQRLPIQLTILSDKSLNRPDIILVEATVHISSLLGSPSVTCEMSPFAHISFITSFTKKLSYRLIRNNWLGRVKKRNFVWWCHDMETLSAVLAMGLLPDTQNRGCACAGNAGNVFPVTAGKRSRHASRHVRHARAVMHAGIAN